jgi:hypothetical protein
VHETSEDTERFVKAILLQQISKESAVEIV